MKIFQMLMLSVLLLVLGSGCMLKKEYVPLPGQENGVTSIGLSSSVIEQKIQTLSDRLQQKDLSDENRALTEDLLDFYRQLQYISSNQYISENRYRYIIREMFKELDMLEQGYFSLLDTYKQNNARTVSAFVAMKQEILRLYRQKRYKGVVKKCLKIRAMFGPDAITPEIGACFAMSLFKTGLTDKAIRIGYNSAIKLEQYPDSVLLEANLAKWQIQAGRQTEAFYVTQRMSRACQQRRKMLQRIKQEQMSYGGTRSEVNITPFDTDNRLKNKKDHLSEIDRTFPDVARLLKEYRFDDARALLLKKKASSTMNDVKIIDRAIISVDLAEKAYRKKRLKEARLFLDQERFDSALACIRDLESLHIADSEALTIKQRASDGLINSERKRAARLFLLARRSADPAKKKALLRSSYSILNSLAKKYPFSPLIKKVKANMQVVFRELSRLNIAPP